MASHIMLELLLSPPQAKSLLLLQKNSSLIQGNHVLESPKSQKDAKERVSEKSMWMRIRNAGFNSHTEPS